MRIRRAISDDALVFIACFSHESGQRDRSYQNEELNLAIEQLRLHRPDDPWLIPVRLDDCEIPDRELGAGRTLASLQHADLFGDRRDGETSRLVESVLRMLRRDPGQLGQDLSPTRQAVLAYLRALAELASWLHVQAGEPVSGISTTAASIMVVGELSRAIAGLEPTAEEKRCVRSILIRLRANQDSFFSDNLPGLEPVIEDLSAWKTWVKPPTNELLAAVRRTSNIGDWITALPSLPTPVP